MIEYAFPGRDGGVGKALIIEVAWGAGRLAAA
jgi:hypothetical protein